MCRARDTLPLAVRTHLPTLKTAASERGVYASWPKPSPFARPISEVRVEGPLSATRPCSYSRPEAGPNAPASILTSRAIYALGHAAQKSLSRVVRREDQPGSSSPIKEKTMAVAFKGTVKLDVRDSKPDWNAFLDRKAP